VAAAVVDAEDDDRVVDRGERDDDATTKADCPKSGADVVARRAGVGECREALAVGDEFVDVAVGDLGRRG
jgi:hypothetical protein